MQPVVGERLALVLGGTGAVGSAVLKGLAKRGVRATFTFCRSEEKARVLALEYGHRAIHVDFEDAEATRNFLGSLETGSPLPDLLIHCATTNAPPLALVQIGQDDWQRTIAVNAQSAFLACQWFANQRPPNSSGDIVLVGALDRAQSLPLPIHFAASQGMLSAMVMAMAHELGPRGIRINLIALGVLNSGLSERLDSKRRRDYEQFSALRRVGNPEEAARAILWLALENRYIHGKVLSVNGGI